MKTIIRLLTILGLLSLLSNVNGQTLSSRMSISKTKMSRADINDFTPFVNTIKYNHGDTIVELLTPPIGNQGDQGSCAGWAFGYGCASIQAYEVYQDWNWARRSPAYLFNIGKTNCYFAHSDTITRLMHTRGVCAFSLMLYDENDCQTQPNSIQNSDAALNKSLRSYISDSSDVAEYKQFLKIGHPIGIVTNYARDLKRVWNTSSLNGIWSSIVISSQDSAHALCVVGFDDHQRLFKAMNSWDSIKGDNGFVWISYDLVQNGVFDVGYVFESESNGFVPQIQGSSDFCGPEECYSVANVPAGCTYSWSVSSNFLPGDIISSGQGTSSVCIQQKQGLTPAKGEDRALPVLPRSILSVTISDPNNNTYTISKSIYNPSPKPFITVSDTTSNWPAGQTRTFSMGCTSVTANHLRWVIKKTKTVYFQQYITTDTIYGRTMSYTPTWSSGTSSMTLEITATNLKRTCPDNNVTKTYNVYQSYREQLIQSRSDGNNEYTLELWHSVYGFVRSYPTQNIDEQIDTTGLPQGVYIVILKENGQPIKQTKLMVP